MHKDRQYERKSISVRGSIRIAGGDEAPVAVDILDISPGGAKIKAQKLPNERDKVLLGIGSLGEFAADVVWSRPPHAGIAFTESPMVMNEVIIAVALYGSGV